MEFFYVDVQSKVRPGNSQTQIPSREGGNGVKPELHTLHWVVSSFSMKYLGLGIPCSTQPISIRADGLAIICPPTLSPGQSLARLT